MKQKMIITMDNYSFIHNPTETVNKILNSEIDIVRVNFSKEQEQNILCNKLLSAFSNRYKKELLLDLPLPCAKSRMFFYNHNSNIMGVRKNEVYVITNRRNGLAKNEFFITGDQYINCNIGDQLLIGDGEGSLSVVTKEKDKLYVRSENDFEFVNGKAINIKYDNCNMYDHYVKYVNHISPNIIALSFVEKAMQIEYMRSKIDAKINIYSKIETEEGVNNIDEIVDVSDGIIIGRGDFAIYSKLGKFLDNEYYIINKAKEKKCPVYVATDILDSLAERSYPNRAELIDVLVLNKLNVDGYVFSAKIKNYNNLKRFFDIINKVD